MPKYRHSKKFLQNHTVYVFNKKQLLFWVCMIVDEENVNFPNFDVFKLWCWRRLESPLDSKESKPINPKGNQPWIFTGGTDAEAEAQILWPPNAKSWLIGKDLDAGKDWGLEEKGMTEDEMVGWHHWLNGHEFEQTPGDSEGQGSLACCSPWGRRDLDATEQQQYLIFR